MALFLGGFTVRRTKSLAAGALVAWSLISAAMIFVNPEQITYGLLELRLKLVSARSFITISMLVTFICLLKQKWVETFLFFFEWLAVINAILLLVMGQGIFGASSMDATWCAVVFPSIVLREKQRPFIEQFVMALIPVMAFVFADVGSTCFVVLALSFTAYFVLERKYLLSLVFTSVILGTGFWATGNGMWRSQDRLDKWSMFLSWWSQHVSVFFGAGSGTFSVLGPEIQSAVSPEVGMVNGQLAQTNLFTFFHSDWLQILFEQGLLGLGLAVILAFICFKKSLGRPWLFSTLCGTSFAMVTYFPLRFFVSQIFVLLIIRTALIGEEYARE